MKKIGYIVPPSLWMVPFLFFIALQVNQGQPISDTASPYPSKAVLIRVSSQNGNILQNRTPFLLDIDEAGNPFKATKAISIEYGWQMLDGEEWHQTCKYPRLGIGAQYLRVMKRDELGHPFSVYGFYDGNYLWSKNFQLTNRAAAGLAYGFTTYNPNDVLPNNVIGTKVNAFVELGLGMALRLNDFIFIEPGFRFNHFSNGNLRKPQRGVNIVSYSVGLRYDLGGVAAAPAKIPISKIQHRHEVLAFGAMASRQIEFDNINSDLPPSTFGLNYLMANLHTGYYYTLSHRLKIGGGLDWIYDGTNGVEEVAGYGTPHKSDVAFKDKIGLAVFVGWESVIDKLSFVTQVGYMVAQTRFERSTPAFEQRLGFKYHFYRNIFMGVNVRAYNFRAAKAIEFNVGVRKPIK